MQISIALFQTEGDPFKYIEAWIKVMRDSPLAIIAGCVCFVAVGAFILFRNADIVPQWRGYLFIAMVASFMFFVYAAVTVSKPPNKGTGPDPSATVNFHGRVVDPSGDPVTGAIVTMDADGTLPASTDSNGQFYVQGQRPEGPVLIRVRKAGFQNYQNHVSPDAANQFEEIPLTPNPKKRKSDPVETVEKPPPLVAHAGPIRWRADSFDRNESRNIRVNADYGDGVITSTGDPAAPSRAVYHVNAPRSGSYELTVEYASGEMRPVEISINGLIAKTDGLSELTGPPGKKSFEEAFQQEKPQCNLRLVVGDNTLSFARTKNSDNSLPYIKTIVLKPNS